jgi:hypothetical protein
MRTLSPIRSVSPGPKPKIVFNYQPSPLRERPSTNNVTPNGKYALQTVMVSPNTRTNNFINDFEKDVLSVENKCAFCPKQVLVMSYRQRIGLSRREGITVQFVPSKS